MPHWCGGSHIFSVVCIILFYWEFNAWELYLHHFYPSSQLFSMLTLKFNISSLIMFVWCVCVCVCVCVCLHSLLSLFSVIHMHMWLGLVTWHWITYRGGSSLEKTNSRCLHSYWVLGYKDVTFIQWWSFVDLPHPHLDINWCCHCISLV